MKLELLGTKDHSGRPLFQVIEDFQYPIGVNTVITVPAGYITNFGTIPRWFYSVVAPSEMREASVVHDFLCNEQFTIDSAPINSGFSRRVADAILYDHLRKIGIGWFRASLIYFGVRFWAIFTGQE